MLLRKSRVRRPVVITTDELRIHGAIGDRILVTPEELATELKAKWNLSSIHIFNAEKNWRVFGFRNDAKGFQASAERGEGPSICHALANLDARLAEGPIHK